MKSLGATTVALVCVSPSAAGNEGNADYLISAVTGPEVVTGSTRMKAGTATKLVLNMISTGIMIKLGKTYGNLVRASFLSTICASCGQHHNDARPSNSSILPELIE